MRPAKTNPMLAILWRAIIFVSALWLIQRFLGALLGTGARRRPAPNPGDAARDSSRMVKDPVCGMYLDSRLAIAVEAKKGTHYFCSKECRSKYLANPI
jgi:YHS domain-containing protein